MYLSPLTPSLYFALYSFGVCVLVCCVSAYAVARSSHLPCRTVCLLSHNVKKENFLTTAQSKDVEHLVVWWWPVSGNVNMSHLGGTLIIVVVIIGLVDTHTFTVRVRKNWRQHDVAWRSRYQPTIKSSVVLFYSRRFLVNIFRLQSTFNSLVVYSGACCT